MVCRRFFVLSFVIAVAAGCSGQRDSETATAPSPASSEPVVSDVATRSTRIEDGTTSSEPLGADPPETYSAAPPAAFEAATVGGDNLPPAAGALPEEPDTAIATTAEPPADHVVRVFYATDRSPSDVASGAPDVWRLFVPAMAAGAVLLTAIVTMTFLPRRAISTTIAVVSLGATFYFAQSGFVRAQQLRRAATFGDRTYGSGRHEAEGRPVLELGVCEVTIPPDHRVGQVESPSILRFEFSEDPEKHVILARVVRLPDDRYFSALRETVERSSAKQAFVFVHGYNVGFDDAVKRTAQIAYDLRFDGAPICYSWPSNAGIAQYTRDEANVAWTVTQLETFLRDVSERSGARTVHLVAHSMGTRALVQAIERLSLRGDRHKFGQVILAAPDLDAGEFRNRYAPALAESARRVTLYASSNDRALLASTRVHGYTRAGLSGEHLVVVPGLDTIDVSPIDTSLIGHSYYGDNPLMIRDLVAVIHQGLPADGREWLRRTLRTTESFYWAFRPDMIAERP